MKERAFWIVWSGARFGTPTVKHDTLASARAEAERLTRQHGGGFHVMQLVGTATRADVVWTEADDIPF